MASVKLAYGILAPLALSLIKDPAMHLGHLQGVSLVFVMESGWKGDKEFLFGRVSLKSHLTAVALQGLLREGETIECDNTEKCFLVEVNEDLWNAISNPDSGYKPEEAEAKRLQGMYHLLLHCQVHPETQVLMTAKPDTRLFSEEISVWGEDGLTLRAVMSRLKNRPTGNDLLLSLYLTPNEWTRAQAIGGVDHPKKNFKVGKGRDILVIGEKPSEEAFLVLDTDPQCDEGGRFRHAVRVKAWEQVHGQPELPYDTRFVVPGMQVETEGVSWDDAQGQDVEPTGGRWVIAHTGYRLLEPEYGSQPKEEGGETAEGHGALIIKVDDADEDGIPASEDIVHDLEDNQTVPVEQWPADRRNFANAVLAANLEGYITKDFICPSYVETARFARLVLYGRSTGANLGVQELRDADLFLAAGDDLPLFAAHVSSGGWPCNSKPTAKRDQGRAMWPGSLSIKEQLREATQQANEALAVILSDDEWEASAKRLGIGEGDTLGLPEPVGALAGADAAAGQIL